MGVFLSLLGLWVSIVVLLFAAAILGLCVIAAPFSAIACGVLARVRGRSIWRSALEGGLYSMMFFLPVVYFVGEMLDRKPPELLVKLGYLAVYATWIVAAIMGPFYFVAVFDSPSEILYSKYNTEARLLAWMSFVTFAGSLLWLVIGHRAQTREDFDDPYVQGRPQPREVPLTSVMYVAPFGLAAFWVFLTAIGLGVEVAGLQFLEETDL